MDASSAPDGAESVPSSAAPVSPPTSAAPPKSTQHPLNRQDLWSVARRTVWLAVGIVAGIWLIFSLTGVLTIVLISLILATGLRPLVEWLYDHHLPRPLAVLLIYLGFIVVLVGLGFLIVPTLAEGVGAIVSGAPELASTLQKDLQALEQQNSFLAPLLDPLTKQLPSFATQVGAIAGQVLGVAAFALTAASGLLNIVLVLLLTFYLVTDGPRIQGYVLSFVPPRQRERARRMTSEMGRRMGGWLLGQIVVSAVVGVVTYAVLDVLGVPGALILAVVAAIVVVVPIIGTFLALVPAVLVALTQSPLLALITFIVLFVLQQVEMNILGPLIFQRTVKIHPAAVLLSLLIGGALLGGTGALIAVPVAAAVSVALDEWRYKDAPDAVTGTFAGGAPVAKVDALDRIDKVNTGDAAPEANGNAVSSVGVDATTP